MRARHWFIGSLVAALATLIAVAGASHASVPPIVAAADSLAAVGPGYVDSWSVSCGASATKIVPSGVALVAFECAAPEAADTGGTTLVGIGDSAIADPAFATRNAPVICGSGCNASRAAVNARQGYCRADSGSVTLFCWGISTSASQP